MGGHAEYQIRCYFPVVWERCILQCSTVDVCVTGSDSLHILWISRYTVYQRGYVERHIDISLTLLNIPTRYGLGGAGIESRCGLDISHPSRPALEPTQHTVQWVPGLSRGVKRPGRVVDHPPPQVERRLKEKYCNISTPLLVLRGRYKGNVT